MLRECFRLYPRVRTLPHSSLLLLGPIRLSNAFPATLGQISPTSPLKWLLPPWILYILLGFCTFASCHFPCMKSLHPCQILAYPCGSTHVSLTDNSYYGTDYVKVSFMLSPSFSPSGLRDPLGWAESVGYLSLLHSGPGTELNAQNQLKKYWHRQQVLRNDG